jgi:hypothetical protein
MITIISTIRADHTHGDGCGGAAAWVFRPRVRQGAPSKAPRPRYVCQAPHHETGKKR